MISVRKFGVRKQLAVIMAVAMVFTGVGPTILRPQVVHAQMEARDSRSDRDSSSMPATCGSSTSRSWWRRTMRQAGRLLGPGPNQVADPQLPRGLRTVDGSDEQPRARPRSAPVRGG